MNVASLKSRLLMQAGLFLTAAARNVVASYGVWCGKAGLRRCGRGYVTHVHIGRDRMRQETLKLALKLADSFTTRFFGIEY